MNFTFIPSPEKAKIFTAVEDATARISALKLGEVEKWFREVGTGCFKKNGHEFDRSKV